MNSKNYDFAIIGSGLGGLQCGYILASEGYSVIIIEKNRQLGGSLQIFSRNKQIFDTGVHYIGGLDEGQNLNQFFKYFDIMNNVKFKKLDIDGFDVIKFKDDNKYYKFGQGYDHFQSILIADFPEEKNAIQAYCEKIKAITLDFPMYNIDASSDPIYYTKDYLTQDTLAYLQSITQNQRLISVLSGINLLYAGVKDETPLYVHALVVNSYIESAYRVVDGGSKIAIHLAKKIRHFGGKIVNNTAVIGSTFNEDNTIKSLILDNGKTIHAKNVISNIAPEQLIKITGEKCFKRAYISRIENLKKTISSFTLHLTFADNTVKYMNNNIYYFAENDAWNTTNYSEKDWPINFIVSMPFSKRTTTYSNVMSVISYMHFDEVKAWENTFKTDTHKNERGETYLEWKKIKEQKMLDVLDAEIFPGIKKHVIHTESSTPLTYRDYIGNSNGAMYGTAKDYKSPIKTFINTKTKVPNLFLTGQYLNLHGVLGVTVSSFITCFEFVNKDKLVEKIKKAK